MNRNTALELNRKSRMVEEAVEEVLDLVKKAAQQFKNDDTPPEFDFTMDEGEKIYKQVSIFSPNVIKYSCYIF